VVNIFFSFGSFLIAFFLVIIFSLLCTALLHSPIVPVNILSTFLLSFFNVILVSEIAGTLSLLENRLFFLFIHAVLAGIAFLLWQRSSRPPLFIVYTQAFSKYKLGNMLASLRKWPSVWVLGIVVCIFYLFCGYLIVRVPPNNYDSMTSHMVRVAYWLQHGNFQPWSTWDYTQKVYPINAQVSILWTVLFSGGDRFAGFPQWISALAAMVAIFGIARVLGWSRIQSSFAALVWAFLPEVLLEATTTQNHMVATSFFVCMLYLLILGLREHNKLILFLSGLSLALALGTHQLIFMAIPGLGLAVLVFSVKMGRIGFRLILTWAGGCCISILLVGSYMYIINIVRTGNPLASNEFYSADGVTVLNFHNAISDLKIQIPRYVYASFDLTGFPDEIANPIYEYRTLIAKELINKFYIPIEGGLFTLDWRPPAISEDTAWFGFLGFAAFPIVGIGQLWRSIKCKDLIRAGLFIIIIGYIICFIIFFVGLKGRNVWSPYQGRYFILISTLLAPFLASLLRTTHRLVLLNWIIAILSICIASFVMLNNTAKPLRGPLAIWNLDRSLLLDLNSWQFHKAVNIVDENVPADARMGIMLIPSFYEYPFFGEHLNRQLIPIYPDSQLSNTQWLNQEKIDWILLCKNLSFPKGFTEVSNFPAYLDKCWLLQRGN
jgi:4-amino-4-deoxy-L-arabinose transferase-like glycosyltransferase